MRPGYNDGSSDLREVLLYDAIIEARRSSGLSYTPTYRLSCVCDGRHSSVTARPVMVTLRRLG